MARWTRVTDPLRAVGGGWLGSARQVVDLHRVHRVGEIEGEDAAVEVEVCLTRETDEGHFWSRRGEELWHKGAMSGDLLNFREILADCGADTVPVKVDGEGPACHTGGPSFFF